jgi:hypothetical protein
VIFGPPGAVRVLAVLELCFCGSVWCVLGLFCLGCSFAVFLCSHVVFLEQVFDPCL